jgi:hypothetical protein
MRAALEIERRRRVLFAVSYSMVQKGLSDESIKSQYIYI